LYLRKERIDLDD